MTVRLFFPVALLFTLVGCTTLGPDYEQPELEMPGAWRTSMDTVQDIANQEWWRTFDDPVLDELVVIALKNNRDLRLAAARVEEYAARVDIARAGYYPQVGYGGSADRTQYSRNTLNGVPDGVSRTGDNYQAALNVGWELDFWGKVQRATEAARADLLAAEYGRRATILTLVSAVATGYVQLRNLDRQLEITRETLVRRSEAVDLFETQLSGGVVSELEVAQVRSEYEAAAVRLPRIEQNIHQLENALSVLLGRNPGTIKRGKPAEKMLTPGIPADIPSEVLQRRPDVLSAEQYLVAANAQIGLARAYYFPSISLTGLLGLASADLSDLLEGASGIWSLGGELAGPIFTGGRLDAQVRVSEAIQQQALHNYVHTVQTSFREVEDALVANEKLKEVLAATGRQVAALKDYARHARSRYEEGYVSYIEVLDSERLLFDAELEYTNRQSEVFTSLVAIYKAMGGGWINTAEAVANEVDFPPVEDEDKPVWDYPARTWPSAAD